KAAIGAVKYSFLRVATKQEIAFSLKESVNLEGDSGPYLQYTYARCKSVLRKAPKERTADSKELLETLNAKSYTLNAEERAVARLILYFPEIVVEAAQNLAPSALCAYLFALAQAFNFFYQKHTILGDTRQVTSDTKNKKANSGLSRVTSHVSRFRLALTAATAQVLQNGLYFLGIATLEQM
ncbi:MAG: DALR anticodon-binding domain-containing protein, partial [Patescibacteria group bacterium]